jgi:hypothetical protein
MRMFSDCSAITMPAGPYCTSGNDRVIDCSASNTKPL